MTRVTNFLRQKHNDNTKYYIAIGRYIKIIYKAKKIPGFRLPSVARKKTSVLKVVLLNSQKCYCLLSKFY